MILNKMKLSKKDIERARKTSIRNTLIDLGLYSNSTLVEKIFKNKKKYNRDDKKQEISSIDW